jgi:hypothetical protein
VNRKQRAVQGRGAFWQGFLTDIDQFAALIFAEPMRNENPTMYVDLVRAIVFALQAGTAGFLIGCLFQKYYRRTRHVPGKVVGDITLQERPTQSALAT